MGDERRGHTFEEQVMDAHATGGLTVALLDTFGELHRGTDIDTGGFSGRRSRDGRDVRHIVLDVLEIDWQAYLPELSPADRAETDPEDLIADAIGDAFIDVCVERWGWE